MKFDELDASLRVFEEVHDRRIPSGVQIVARLDGRSFSRLTKELMDYDAPYDVRFRDLPDWQKHGYAVLWETYAKEGFNPVTGEQETGIRKQLAENFELPSGDAYSQMIGGIIGG